MSGPAVADVAFALMAESADWVDRLAAIGGASDPPESRRRLASWLGPALDDGDDDAEVADVVELAAFVDFTNRVVR